MSGHKFQIIEDVPVDTAAVAAAEAKLAEARRLQTAATQTMMLALKTIAQKLIIAISNLFSAAALGLAWLLWRQTLPDPSSNQLIGLGVFAVFILALEYIRRR